MPDRLSDKRVAELEHLLAERGNGDATPEEYDRAEETLTALLVHVKTLREAMQKIEDTAQWYADNPWRHAHEVEHALCVEVLAVASDATTRPPLTAMGDAPKR